MTYKLLISGIPLPRKQASSIHEKLFSSGLPTFQLFMTFVCTIVILIPHFLAAQTRDDSIAVSGSSKLLYRQGDRQFHIPDGKGY